MWEKQTRSDDARRGLGAGARRETARRGGRWMIRLLVLLVLVCLMAIAARGARASDVESDVREEHSDNMRALVFGIKCGACKAVVTEIASTFDAVATKHKDAGPTNVFGSRYVSLFRDAFAKEMDKMCSANGAIERDWGYSKQGAQSIITTSKAFDRFGVNLTQEEASTIQTTVYGLGLFTRNEDERYFFDGPAESERRESEYFSLLSNTFARQNLQEACLAVSESLEFDDAVDEAVERIDEGFDYGIQYKLCLDLNYCRVKNKRGKSKPVKRTVEADGSYGVDDHDQSSVDAETAAEL